ncbi:MAG: hypothetical protein V2I33_18760 [Kangiellaceae bacterium]|jgi:hypothetical protein|nr:hypothetical protein [Kangiellaceae bacterium]
MEANFLLLFFRESNDFRIRPKNLAIFQLDDAVNWTAAEWNANSDERVRAQIDGEWGYVIQVSKEKDDMLTTKKRAEILRQEKKQKLGQLLNHIERFYNPRKRQAFQAVSNVTLLYFCIGACSII